MVDIVQQLRKCANKIYHQDGYFFRLGLQNEAADEIVRLREVLQKIADLEHEDLPAPKSANETVLWVCLDRCITLAENALKGNGDA